MDSLIDLREPHGRLPAMRFVAMCKGGTLRKGDTAAVAGPDMPLGPTAAIQRGALRLGGADYRNIR